jgi:hypothetical protein
MDDAPRHKRRWFQYGLLALPLLLAIPGIWLGVKMEHAGRQKAVIEVIENLGGVVWYDYQFDKYDIPNSKYAEPPGPPWLRRYLGDDFFITVTKLDLTQTEIGNAELQQIECLTDLQSLSLGDMVGDAGLAHLSGLSKLQWLDLRKTQCTATGIAGLQKVLPSCKVQR